MAINERVERLLEQSRVDYDVVPHREVFTSQEVAQSMHVTGRMLAKVVVVREPEGKPVMVVVPAAYRVDLDILSREMGRPDLVLATEDDLRRLFPDCELGAMPPFGQLYGMPTYLDRCLEGSPTIFFQAGNHHEVVRMDTKDFIKLVIPLAGELCVHREHAHV